MAWTCLENVSICLSFLDMFWNYRSSLDMNDPQNRLATFAVRHNEKLAESYPAREIMQQAAAQMLQFRFCAYWGLIF